MPHETGLYYLQSRYYNPEIGRFINADRYISTGTGMLGYNIYAYCNNNPVICRGKGGDVLETCLEDADPTNDFMEDVMGGGDRFAEGKYVTNGTNVLGGTGNYGRYSTPAGGGGSTSKININGKIINFGHGGRHLKGTGLNMNEVNKLIADKVSELNLAKGEFYKGRITMRGITLEYTSYGLGGNVTNVGTYYPVYK